MSDQVRDRYDPPGYGLSRNVKIVVDSYRGRGPPPYANSPNYYCCSGRKRGAFNTTPKQPHTSTNSALERECVVEKQEIQVYLSSSLLRAPTSSSTTRAAGFVRAEFRSIGVVVGHGGGWGQLPGLFRRAARRLVCVFIYTHTLANEFCDVTFFGKSLLTTES